MAGYYDRVFDWGIAHKGEVGDDAKAEGRLELWARVLARSDITPTTVLDIGCGDGSLARRMSDAKLGRKFHLTDISESAIAYINDHPFVGLESAIQGDCYDLPYDDGQFDLAVLSHIVEHLSHPRDAIVEAARVANAVLVEVPLQDALLSNAAGAVSKWRSGMPRSLNAVGHLHFFTDRTFRVSVLQWNEVQITDAERYLPRERSGPKRVLTRLGPGVYGRLLQTNGVYLFEAVPQASSVS